MSSSVLADDNKSTLINQIVTAYGGDALRTARTLTIDEEFKSTMPGQSVSPEMLDLITLDRHVIVDFDANRAQVTRAYKRREITFYERRMFNDGHLYTVNLVDGAYTDAPNAKRNSVVGHALLHNDIGLARMLWEYRDTVALDAAVSIGGRPHHTLTFTVPVFGDVTLHSDAKTGLISRMWRKHPTHGMQRTDFSGRVSTGPIQYARRTEVFTGDRLYLMVLERHVTLDKPLPKDFVSLAAYEPRGADMYPREMTVRPLAENVYLVGQAAFHSIFVVEGNTVIGAEAYAGVVDRFKALEKHLGRDLTLTDLVVTHHHHDHLSGVNELAAGLDANMVTVKEHVDEIRSLVTADLDEDRLVTIEDTQAFLGGKVQVFDIATIHSEHNLVFYVPSLKLLFTADYFRSSYENEKIIGFPDLIQFRKSIEALGIEVEKFASVHGVKILTYEQLVKATDSYQPFDCSPYPEICS